MAELAADTHNQNSVDAALEREIEAARRAMTKNAEAGDIEGAREFEAIMRRLIGQRSVWQIKRMERERGLRA